MKYISFKYVKGKSVNGKISMFQKHRFIFPTISPNKLAARSITVDTQRPTVSEHDRFGRLVPEFIKTAASVSRTIRVLNTLRRLRVGVVPVGYLICNNNIVL